MDRDSKQSTNGTLYRKCVVTLCTVLFSCFERLGRVGEDGRFNSDSLGAASASVSSTSTERSIGRGVKS